MIVFDLGDVIVLAAGCVCLLALCFLFLWVAQYVFMVGYERG